MAAPSEPVPPSINFMDPIRYSKEQLAVIDHPASEPLFIEGPAMSGKTTAAIARLANLLKEQTSSRVLILTPQKSLAKPYFDFLSQQSEFKGSHPSILTISGLARLLVEKFWLLFSGQAGFGKPFEKPHFLSLETAQYVLSKISEPYFKQGYFHSVVIERSRLLSQILDNLNKSALVPFPPEEISSRLNLAAGIDPPIRIAFDQAQECALNFRKYCLQHNLLDFSLLIETFRKHAWGTPPCKDYFYSSFQAIVADNIEEDFPVSHDFLREWLHTKRAVTLIYDQGGGYRSFLGADPQNAYKLKDEWESVITFRDQFRQPKPLGVLRIALNTSIQFDKLKSMSPSIRQAYEVSSYQFYPQMISDVCEKIFHLVETEHTHPADIVILAPYLSDALKFSLSQNLSQKRIPHTSSRPSRMYLVHPVIRALITYAKMAYTNWPLPITRLEARNALLTSIPGLDIARADLIVQTLFSEDEKRFRSFDSMTNPVTQERISFQVGEKLENLRQWLGDEYSDMDDTPLDIFISAFYGELLSQKGYKLFEDLEAANTVHQLAQSIQKFRQFSTDYLNLSLSQANVEYIRTLQEGLLPSSFLEQEMEFESALRIEPAHTFLMENRPCDYQFWLDIGSMGWWERLNQPLTNPYLLRRNPFETRQWNDVDEFQSNQQSMLRVVEGLIRRCGKKVFLNAVHVNEYGTEQRGPLLRAVQALQKHLIQIERPDDV